MPYIQGSRRPDCEKMIDFAETMTPEDAVHYLGTYADNPGDRNYSWCRYILRREPKGYSDWSYWLGLIVKEAAGYDAQVFGDSLCMMMEIYRRKIVPYERLKIEENGDVEGFSPETA